jgi:Zn-finger nucleic acid-binding protein
MSESQIECPRCRQDWLRSVLLVHLNLRAVHCPECDALWLGDEPQISEAPHYGEFVDYSTFMEEHGRLQPQAAGEVKVVGFYMRDAKEE